MTEGSGEHQNPPSDDIPPEDKEVDPEFVEWAKKRMQELKRSTPLDLATPSEAAEIIPPDRRIALQRRWVEKLDPITASELTELILSAEFGQRVVEAIRKTDDPDGLLQGLTEGKGFRYGQEFGFVVFRHPGNIEPIHISPLFAGDEKSINLFLQSEEHRRQVDYYGSRQLVFHTHPNILENRINAVFEEYLKGLPLPDHGVFSQADLRNFRRIAEEEDTTVIYALGVRNRSHKNGRLLLASFNNFDQFADFDPSSIRRRYAEYGSTQPVAARKTYREAGLNVAALSVNLSGSSPVFNTREVAKASTTLTRRE